MRVLLALALGATATVLVYAIWRPTIAWTLTRIPPATPPGHQPRYRTWTMGVENGRV